MATEAGPLFRKALTPDLEERLRDLSTPSGATLSTIVRSGRENPDSSIGCYAADEDSYAVFAPLFDPVIETYHGFGAGKTHRGGLSEETVLPPSALDDGGLIVSTRVRVGRNLSGYPFPSMISGEERLVVEEKLVAALATLTGDLSGRYYSLAGMAEMDRRKLVEDHFLFKRGDRFLASAGINRDWPHGRGIYHSGDKRFLAWVGEEDHLRIIAMEPGGDIAGVFTRLRRAAAALEEQLDFAFDPRLGYLSSCPTNLGTAMRASVHIRLPLLSARPEFKETCGNLGLSVRGIHGEHSESCGGVYDISNRQRLGKPEGEIIAGLCSGLSRLVEMERNL